MNDAELLATLTALESELHHPGAPCSRERLETLLHPDFDEVGRSGRRYDRETVIRFLEAQGGQPDVVSADYAVQLIAADVALLTYRSAQRRRDGVLALRALRSSVWTRTPQGWRLRYHQARPRRTRSERG